MDRLNKRLGAGLFVAGLMAMSAGCSIASKNANGGVDSVPNYELIAENMLDVLAADERLHYTNTTFQITQPETPFAEALYNQLNERGYGVQLVSGDVGANFIRYEARPLETDQGTVELYSMSVRDVTVERQYWVMDGKSVPTSPVTLTTDVVREVDLDDRLFEAELDPEISRVVYVDTGAPEVVLINKPAPVAEGFVNTPSEPVRLRNVYDIRKSNFASVFKQYNNVSRVTLVFGNDSLTLGNRNRAILHKLAREINPETDIISIIGCSHGNTALQSGNQLLAEGRAQRVTESLMFAGVKPDLIMDEACWAEGYWDDVAPRRGVLVTHKRLKGES